MNCWGIDTGYEIIDTGDGEDRDVNVGERMLEFGRELEFGDNVE